MDLFWFCSLWWLIVVDVGSRWIEVILVGKSKANTYLAFETGWLWRWGRPQCGGHDVGGEFVADLFISLCDRFKMTN